MHEHWAVRGKTTEKAGNALRKAHTLLLPTISALHRERLFDGVDRRRLNLTVKAGIQVWLGNAARKAKGTSASLAGAQTSWLCCRSARTQKRI